MDKPLDHFRKGRLKQTKNALQNNNFEVFIAGNADVAKDMVVGDIIPSLMNENGDTTAAFGGSMTLVGTGIYEAVKGHPDLRVLDTYDLSRPIYEVLETRRKALLTDIFLMGSNAVTEDGKLVNLDGFGNRVAALAFGPKNVIVVAGRNKLVPDAQAAMARVKDIAAPANAIRLDRKTPCTKTLHCENCNSPERICNVWTISEKSFPKGRIKVVLVDEDLGF